MNHDTADINAARLRWAQQHDWFATYLKLRHVSDMYVVFVRDDTQECRQLDFTNFEALRAWAGY